MSRTVRHMHAHLAPPPLKSFRRHCSNLKTDLLNARAQGALVRSRFHSAALMDSPSKFFFSLEQKNGQSRQIQTFMCSSTAVLEETNTELEGHLTEAEASMVCPLSFTELSGLS